MSMLRKEGKMKSENKAKKKHINWCNAVTID